MPDFNISVREQNGVVIIDTDGYLNNVGGEIIASECYSQVDKGKKDFILNLEKTPVVNSIGVSIIIEIIEKLQDVNGSRSYFNLAPIVDKTFSIMGLTKYSTIYTNEEEALKFVTINPAIQLGIDQWVGSLEIGKEADFVIWSGHPLSTMSKCEETWIDGIQYFSIEKVNRAYSIYVQYQQMTTCTFSF